jgi:hypothetical protein
VGVHLDGELQSLTGQTVIACNQERILARADRQEVRTAHSLGLGGSPAGFRRLTAYAALFPVGDDAACSFSKHGSHFSDHIEP